MRLCHTGYSRLERENPLLVLLVERHFVRQMRTRTDQAHIAHQYVEELRKLVHVVATEKLSQTGDSGIVLDLEQRSFFPFVHGLEFALLRVCVHDHGTEFEHAESRTGTSDPDARIKRRVPILQVHEDRDDEKQR